MENTDNAAVPVLLMQHFEEGKVVRVEASKKSGATPRAAGFWPGVWQRLATGQLFLIQEHGTPVEGSAEELIAYAARQRTAMR